MQTVSGAEVELPWEYGDIHPKVVCWGGEFELSSVQHVLRKPLCAESHAVPSNDEEVGVHRGGPGLWAIIVV